MSNQVFRDKIFPAHVAAILADMHKLVFLNTDPEDQVWPGHLTMAEKECVALGLAVYYWCDHCIHHHKSVALQHHSATLEDLDRNSNAMVLFLRTVLDQVSPGERKRWLTAWDRSTSCVRNQEGGNRIPDLLGLAIGMARNDDQFIDLFGRRLLELLADWSELNQRALIGELEAVVIFMKAAASKNRIAHKLENLFTKL